MPSSIIHLETSARNAKVKGYKNLKNTWFNQRIQENDKETFKDIDIKNEKSKEPIIIKNENENTESNVEKRHFMCHYGDNKRLEKNVLSKTFPQFGENNEQIELRNDKEQKAHRKWNSLEETGTETKQESIEIINQKKEFPFQDMSSSRDDSIDKNITSEKEIIIGNIEAKTENGKEVEQDRPSRSGVHKLAVSYSIDRFTIQRRNFADSRNTRSLPEGFHPLAFDNLSFEECIFESSEEELATVHPVVPVDEVLARNDVDSWDFETMIQEEHKKRRRGYSFMLDQFNMVFGAEEIIHLPRKLSLLDKHHFEKHRYERRNAIHIYDREEFKEVLKRHIIRKHALSYEF